MPGHRGIALLAASSGLLAVVLAAVGAHVVPLDDGSGRQLWATALQIHMFHTLALLAVAALLRGGSAAGLSWSAMLMAVGTLLFSGSLYLRASGIALLPGPLTPFGGLLLMGGWLVLILSFIRKVND